MKDLLQSPLQRDHQGTSTPWHLLVVLFLEMFHSSPLSSPGKTSLPLALPLLICFHHRKNEKRRRPQRCCPGVAGTSLVQSGGEEGERWQLFFFSQHPEEQVTQNPGPLNTLHCSGCCLSQPAHLMRERALRISKGAVFPSLSQVSILNQHYHFKRDRSERNLQRERDTGTEKTPQTHNPMQTPTRPAQELCCCHQRGSVRRDIYTAPGLTEKTFLLCHEIPPAALSRVSQLCHPRVERKGCFPRGGR